MSVLPKLMEFVSLRKVCDAVSKEEIYTLQRGVMMAKEANNKLAPNPEVFKTNQSKLAKAEELLDMKETVLKEEARLKELVAARERLLLTQRPPEHSIKAKKIELEAITRFVNEYQQYRRTCPALNRSHNGKCPNQHRCKNCAIDEESDEEDGPFFKKKRATPENPRGSLELHLSDKVYYYLVERDEMIVIDRDSLPNDTESSISCTETEISESVTSESEVLSVSESDSQSTVCASSSNTKFFSPSCNEFFDLDKLKELINESRKTDKRLDDYRKHVIEMCQRHKAEERLFRETTNKLMSRYGIIDKNLDQAKPSERVNHYKNSGVFCPLHSHKPMRGSFDDSRKMRGSFDNSRMMRGSFDNSRMMRGSFDGSRRMQGSFDDSRRMQGSFDDSRRSARFMVPKPFLCENCVMKKFMGKRNNLQRPCASTYSTRPPTPWSATSNTQDMDAISKSFQHALWPKTSTRQ